MISNGCVCLSLFDVASSIPERTTLAWGEFKVAEISDVAWHDGAFPNLIATKT